MAREVVHLVGGVLLVLATSVDGFSAGVAYGFRRVRLSPLDRALVAGISVVVLVLAMVLARAVGGIFPDRWAYTCGSTLLIGLGAWTILRSLLNGGKTVAPRVWSWRVPSLGLVIQILREPMEADLDASGTISAGEAIWLGVALSLDVFAAGFCAGLGARLPVFLPLVVGAVNWIFLTAGIGLGNLAAGRGCPHCRSYLG